MSDEQVMKFFRSALATDSNKEVVEKLCDMMNKKSGIDRILKQVFGGRQLH